MSDHSSEMRGIMPAIEKLRTEMQDKVHLLARPSEPGESVKSCIRRVAKKTQLSFGQIRRLWYRESLRPPGDVVDIIRDAVRRNEHEIDREFSQLKARYNLLAHETEHEDYHAPGLGEGHPKTARSG